MYCRLRASRSAAGASAVVPAAVAIIAAQGIWSSRVFADHPAAGLAAVLLAVFLGETLWLKLPA